MFLAAAHALIASISGTMIPTTVGCKKKQLKFHLPSCEMRKINYCEMRRINRLE